MKDARSDPISHTRSVLCKIQWTAKLYVDGNYDSDVECDALTLLEAAQILTAQLGDDCSLRDLCARGWVTP